MLRSSGETIYASYKSLVFVPPVVIFFLAIALTSCSRDPNVRRQKYLESGERYFAEAQYTAAAIQFRNALQADPAFPAAHYQLGCTYVQLRDFNNAYRELERTIELQPENYPARLDLANLLLATGDLKSAQEQIDELVAHQPDRAEVHQARGNLLAVQQDFPAAIQELQNAISLNPQRGEPFLDLALIQLKTNQPVAAEANFKKAIELMPKSIQAVLALGGYYQTQRRFAEAEQQLLRAVDMNQNDPEPRIALARLYMAENKKTAAEDFLRKSKKDFPDNSVGYRMLGDLYFAIGDLDNAIVEYSSLAKEHPKDIQVSRNYVQLLILKSRNEEARKLNDDTLKHRPGDVESLIERGQIEIAEGHPTDGINTLQTAVRNDPNSSLAFYHLGIALDRAKKPEEAEKAWRDAVRLKPDLVEAQRALSQVALRKGDMIELEQYATQIVNLQPAAPDGYAMRALARIRRGQLAQAEPDVQHAISAAPQNAAGYLQKGNLMLAQRKFREAEQAFQQALDRDPGSSDGLAGLMNTLFAQNQPANAFNAARTQIAKSPTNSVMYDLLGTALFDHKRDQRDAQDAQATFEKVVQLDEHNIDAWSKLIQIQAVRNSADQALATCQRALEKNSEEANLYVLLGELHNSKQQWDEAKKAFQKALAINPQNPIASNDLAYAMLQTGGNPDLAMPLAETARRGLPDSPQVADTMGWALYQKGAYDSAIDQFKEALRLTQKAKSPDNPTVHYHLGLAYERVGQSVLAREHLRRVLKISPDYSRAEDVKKLLSQLHG